MFNVGFESVNFRLIRGLHTLLAVCSGCDHPVSREATSSRLRGHPPCSPTWVAALVVNARKEIGKPQQCPCPAGAGSCVTPEGCCSVCLSVCGPGQCASRGLSSQPGNVLPGSEGSGLQDGRVSSSPFLFRKDGGGFPLQHTEPFPLSKVAFGAVGLQPGPRGLLSMPIA